MSRGIDIFFSFICILLPHPMVGAEKGVEMAEKKSPAKKAKPAKTEKTKNTKKTCK